VCALVLSHSVTLALSLSASLFGLSIAALNKVSGLDGVFLFFFLFFYLSIDVRVCLSCVCVCVCVCCVCVCVCVCARCVCVCVCVRCVCVCVCVMCVCVCVCVGVTGLWSLSLPIATEKSSKIKDSKGTKERGCE